MKAAGRARRAWYVAYTGTAATILWMLHALLTMTGAI